MCTTRPTGTQNKIYPSCKSMGEGSPQAKLVGGVLDTNLTQTLEQLSARDGSQAGLRKVRGT